MKTDNYIQNYIYTEKQIQINPYLSEKIMVSLESNTTKKITIWKTIAAAASVAIVIMLGFKAGGIYSQPSNKTIELSINDSKIENLSMYDYE